MEKLPRSFTDMGNFWLWLYPQFDAILECGK